MRLKPLFLLISILSLNAQAQQDSVKKTTITLATLYSSNVSYYGQATQEKLPYILGNVTVTFPIGLYLSAGSYKLLNYGTGLSATDLGVGFDYDINEKLTTGLAYTYSFYPANSPLLQASNENNINLSAKYIWPWVQSSFNADYAFGQQTDIFLSLSHSKDIIIGSLFNEKNSLSVEPAFELVAGTRHFYEVYTTEKNNRNNGNGKGKNPIIPGNPNSIETTTVISADFNLLSYNFKLPLSLSRANYIAEISYQLSIPGQKIEPELKQQQSFFSAAFYYQF